MTVNDQDKAVSKPFMERFLVAMAQYDDIGTHDIAVAVSGGPDSMALCFALAEHYADKTVHALTVDHGLRTESGDEAQQVAGQLQKFSNVQHHILSWQHEEKPQARIQEHARHARYDLMKGKMEDLGIIHLFLGHHMGDQAETFLFRLAKGSGLDGLACMHPVQPMDSGFVLCRPLLEFQKEELISFCNDRGVFYINDPSNESDDFARVRLRKSMSVLEEEGLSAKRLSVSASRFSRARSALEYFSSKAFEESVSVEDSNSLSFKYDILKQFPEEIILRVILKSMAQLQQGNVYGARMEKVEGLCHDLIYAKTFRKRTLGGVIFERNDKDNTLILSQEKAH